MNAQASRIGVIVPCYNGAAFVAQTLESVLAQTANVELVVVDDGSTDATPALLERYGPRITVVRHQGGVNRGLSASRNLGIQHTTAPYLSFLDADDLWHPDKLAIEARVMDTHPDVGVVVSGCYAIDPENKRLYDYPPFEKIASADLPSRLLLDCFIQTPGQALIRRSVLETVGCFDSNLLSAEDHDMWLRLAEVTRFVFLEDRTVAYRRHPSSMSNAGAKRMWQQAFSVLEKAEHRRYYGRVAVHRRAVLHYRMAQCEWGDRARWAAANHAVQAVWYHPGRALKQFFDITRVRAVGHSRAMLSIWSRIRERSRAR